MREAVTPPAMIEVAVIKVATTKTTEPAVDVHVRAIHFRAVYVGAVPSITNGLRASGQAKTDANQQQHQDCSRHYSATIHGCPLLHPVIYIDVARAVAGSVGQYAFACHLLVVRRDRARLDV